MRGGGRRTVVRRPYLKSKLKAKGLGGGTCIVTQVIQLFPNMCKALISPPVLPKTKDDKAIYLKINILQ
jgi:hypothetical protein